MVGVPHRRDPILSAEQFSFADSLREQKWKKKGINTNANTMKTINFTPYLYKHLSILY